MLDNQTYVGIEAPKGEFGVFISTKKELNSLWRCKIRSPGFFHLQSSSHLLKNCFIADAVVLIGTFDIVFGEIDR